MKELTGLDARFLYSETRAGHMHTLKIAVVDVSGRADPLTFERFVEAIGSRLDRLPILRQRPIPIPFRLGHPVWFEDPNFEITDHLNWRTAREPGGDRELAEIIAEVAAKPLRRDRPLWELTVVNGLENSQAAFVVKLHHAVADGGGAVAMLINAFVVDDDLAFSQLARPEPLPSTRTLLRSAIAGWWRQFAVLPAIVRRTVRGLSAARRARRLIGVRLPSLFGAARTPFNVSLDAGRTFAMASYDLDELIAVKRANQATLNDVFLATCGGALRNYLVRRDALPEGDLIAGVPVATNAGERHFSGNHVDNLLIYLGTHVADSHDRVQLIHQTAAAARKVREAFGLHLFEDRAELTPPIFYPLGVRLWARTRLANHLRPPLSIIASNVPGPREQLEVEGGVLTALYSVGPLLEGIGLNITAWSYAGRLYVSVLGSPMSLPDPWELIDDLTAAVNELTASLPTH